ncbi:hypothetical protein pdam_00016096 [Pocillopora damicornis]|uniref:Uncharacterized protein n=1 Tax=Pocillopora damicornis TaxID=46731 RepID=A0A3M6TPN8_POCDA|nr:hypothetical protein pdam_00016096 [Pocillopora damicornis]
MRKASQLLRLFLLFLSLRCSNGAPVDEKEKQFALSFTCGRTCLGNKLR